MDVLSDVLRIVRLTGSVFFTADLYDPWSVSSPPSEVLLRNMPTKADCVSLFHIITEGQCWFKTENEVPFLLGKDSVIIFPHGCSHVMGSDMKVNPVPVMQLLAFDNIKEFPFVKYGGKGEKTRFICGYLLCDQRFNPLLGAMPNVLVLSPQKEELEKQVSKENSGLSHHVLSIGSDSWLDMTLQHLVEEVQQETSGRGTIITRLTELMYVEVLRRYMQSLPEKSNGWLAGLRDPEVGKALMYLHAHPEEKWSVEQLAAKVNISRSAFAQRFSDLIGESPIRYLTGWRMQLAKHLLLQPGLSIATVAEEVGYESDIAFNRAFKRNVGIPPASWREQALVRV